ncbi:MAG: molybdopterin-dependent oxidoreductase [Gemmatimonadota bacterium]
MIAQLVCYIKLKRKRYSLTMRQPGARGVLSGAWGADTGEEEIRGNTVTQNFARSMSTEDAMDPNILLCYEVNGETLPNAHEFPLRHRTVSSRAGS